MTINSIVIQGVLKLKLDVVFVADDSNFG